MPAATQPAVLSFANARRMVEEQAGALAAAAAETVPLLAARGRVLAERVCADRDFPPCARSTRDGYALHAADVATVPAKLRIVARIKAGEAWARGIPLQRGEAAEIMTGAPVPPGADAVVMVEHTAAAGEEVEVGRSVRPDENVVAQAAEARAGDELLRPGTRISSAQIALAAAVGRTELRVHRKPRVAVLSTGDEVVPIAAQPGPAQVRNSNSYSLAAQVAAAGGEAVLLPIAPDEPIRLRQLIEEGLGCDLLLLAGGVSMGRYDLVEPVLAELGAEFFFTGALIQPGRPAVFGRIWPEKARRGGPPADAQAVCFLGLPGNPVSTMVTFELFARPLLDALSGATPVPLVFPQAKLKAEIKVKAGLTRFLPARCGGELEECRVEALPTQGSGDLASVARANCYIVVPPERERIATGEMVGVLVPGGPL